MIGSSGRCSVCGEKLLPILRDGQRGIKCLNNTCTFNFQDQSCPECGKEVVSTEHPDLFQYICQCEDGHKWSVAGELRP